MRRVTLVVGSAVLVYACTSGTTPPGSSAGGRGGASGSGGANQGGESGGDAEAGESLGGNAGSSGNVSGAAGRGGAQAGGASGDSGRAGANGRGGSAGSAGMSSGMAGEGGDSAGAGGEAADPVNVPTLASGTRLRAKVYVGSDGSRHAIGLHDTLLDIDCEFANVGLGEYRCVPPVSQGYYGNIFAGDQCDSPAVGYETACGPHTRHVASRPQETCDGMPRRDVYDIGASIPSAYRDNVGTCEPYPADPNASWFAVTPADTEEFAAGTLEHVPVGGDLTVLVVAAEDGARKPVTFWSDAHPCLATELTGVGYRCVPPPRVNLYTFFANDTCTTEVGYTSPEATAACGPPPYHAIGHRGVGECASSVVSVVEVAPFLVTTGFRINMGVCVPADFGPTMLTRWTIGDEVEPDTLPALARVPSGSTRLRTTIIETPNGSTVGFTSSIVDTELGETCTPQRFEDDIVRCVPSASYLGNFFADSSCTVPVYPETPCSNPTFFMEQVPDGACSEDLVISSLLRANGFHTGPVYERIDETTCTELVNSSYDRFFAIEPMPLTDLVTLTETLE